MPQQSDSTFLGEVLCGMLEVQPRTPQTFVSVNVADSGNEFLIEDGALDRGSSFPHPFGNRDGIEPRIERIESNVWDRALAAS